MLGSLENVNNIIKKKQVLLIEGFVSGLFFFVLGEKVKCNNVLVKL